MEAKGVINPRLLRDCFEAQDIPNTPNFLPQNCIYTTPERPYERTIEFKFKKYYQDI